MYPGTVGEPVGSEITDPMSFVPGLHTMSPVLLVAVDLSQRYLAPFYLRRGNEELGGGDRLNSAVPLNTWS